jgi:hypothetical protein
MSSGGSTVSLRRRVCTYCQLSKRRCDQRLPRCSRCAQRNRECVYPSLSRDPGAGPPPAPSSSSSSNIHQHMPPASLPRSMGALPGSAPARPVPVVTGALDPWPLFFNAQGPANTAISRPAMDWGVGQLSSFPLLWVAQGVCPFVNTSLYGGGAALPPVLLDAYAACSAYAMKNHLNAQLVLGVVEAKAQSLLYDPAQVSWTPLQQLAALQALVMYQLIRWFDGSAHQRALADQAEAVLESWTEAMLARVGQKLFERGQEANLLVVPPPPKPGDTGIGRCGAAVLDQLTIGAAAEPADTETIAAWHQFLFAESCRRTVIFAYSMRGIYAMSKQGYCSIGNRVAQMSYTASSRIWNASTAGFWSQARTAESHHWVERMDFDSMLASARPDEVDSLSVLMAVTYKGPDVVEEWMRRMRTGKGDSLLDESLMLMEMGFEPEVA